MDKGMYFKPELEPWKSTKNGVESHPWIVTRTVYDALGRVSIVTDPYVVASDTTELGKNAPITGRRHLYNDIHREAGLEQLAGIVIDISGSLTSVNSPPVAKLSADDLAPVVVASTASEYDEFGLLDESKDHFGRSTFYRYDSEGRETEIRRDSGTTDGGQTIWLYTRYVYDSFENLLLSTDEFASTATDPSTVPVRAERTIYDSNGQVVRIDRIKDAVVAMDTSGMTSITSTGTVTASTQMSYDAFGNLVQTIAPDGQVTTFEYDSLRRRTATIGFAVPAESVGITTLNGASATGLSVSLRSEVVYDNAGRVEKERTNIYQYVDASDDSKWTCPKSRKQRSSTTRSGTS